MRIAMNSVGAIKNIDQDEKQLQDTVRYKYKPKTDSIYCFFLSQIAYSSNANLI